MVIQFQIKQGLPRALCEKILAEKLFELESLMTLAIDEIFLDNSTCAHSYALLTVMRDFSNQLILLGQRILPTEIKTLINFQKDSFCFQLANNLGPDKITSILLDTLFKSESLANIANNFIFLENYDADKTNFIGVVANLLFQIRELFEYWLLLTPTSQSA